MPAPKGAKAVWGKLITAFNLDQRSIQSRTYCMELLASTPSGSTIANLPFGASSSRHRFTKATSWGMLLTFDPFLLVTPSREAKSFKTSGSITLEPKGGFVRIIVRPLG